MLRSIAIAPALLVLSAVALTAWNGSADPGPDSVRTSPDVDARLTHAYTDFGFALYRGLRAANPDGNVFTSPASAAFALAMTYNGAVGRTAEEMARALGIEAMTLEEVNAANRAWIQALSDTGDERAELAIANSIWHRPAFRLVPDFAARTRDHFDAEVREITTAEAINAWVEEHTRGRIDRIVDPPIPGSVVAYLINALYFKADWTHPFDPERTRDAPFTRPDGSTVTVPMMSQTDRFPVRMGSEAEPFDLLRLPYGEGRFSMVLGLPRAGASLADVAEALEPAAWARWMEDDFSERRVMVGLPRFEVEWESSLVEALRARGMEAPFQGGAADFSGMFEGGGPWIDDVLQKTFLRVDEEGTEAAAVTAGVMVTSMPPSLVFDRPFFLAIYDHATESVLFLGQITDPTA